MKTPQSDSASKPALSVNCWAKIIVSQLALLAVLGSALGAPARQQSRTRPALEGIDPVLLIEGKEVPGKDSLTAEHGGFVYQFSSEATRDRFKKDPEKYGIQLDGACARMGPPVTGSPDAYAVYKDRIYVFGSNNCYKLFSADPGKYLDSEQPAPVWNPTADTGAQGKALLKSVIESMGGEPRWQSVTSYVETRHSAGAAGDVTITNSVRMPDHFRDETASGPNSFGTLLTPAGSFRIFRDQSRHLPDSFGKVTSSIWKHDLLPILLNRNAKDFEVYYAGKGEGMDQLAIKDGGVISTLLLDPATSRIVGITWRGKTPEGFGNLRISYSDYRQVGSMWLPYKAEGKFEGQPDPAHTWTVESYQFNPPDIDSRLRPPQEHHGK
jgi:YHS domain-containing protein